MSRPRAAHTRGPQSRDLWMSFVLLVCQGAKIKDHESFYPVLMVLPTECLLLAILGHVAYSLRVGSEMPCLHG